MMMKMFYWCFIVCCRLYQWYYWLCLSQVYYQVHYQDLHIIRFESIFLLNIILTFTPRLRSRLYIFQLRKRKSLIIMKKIGHTARKVRDFCHILFIPASAFKNRNLTKLIRKSTINTSLTQTSLNKDINWSILYLWKTNPNFPNTQQNGQFFNHYFVLH